MKEQMQRVLASVFTSSSRATSGVLHASRFVVTAVDYITEWSSARLESSRARARVQGAWELIAARLDECVHVENLFASKNFHQPLGHRRRLQRRARRYDS